MQLALVPKNAPKTFQTHEAGVQSRSAGLVGQGWQKGGKI